MGVFLCRVVDQQTGLELSRWAEPNLLAYESMQRVLRQIFPAHQAPMTFELGISGPESYPQNRPNPGTAQPFDAGLTYDGVTSGTNEGGCYTPAMRTSFGYARKAVAFTAALEGDGGKFECEEQEFPNNHSWTPQAESDWDYPWTTDVEEQAPPEWTPKETWEGLVGYPWQRPRKRCVEECEPFNPSNCLRSYMYTWDPSGALDWLCDFRKIGGFPITIAWIIDAANTKLVAAARFRTPVLLRPGCTLRVRYQARFVGKNLTRDFALRFARYAFQKSGARYDAILCRPLLSTAPSITRRTLYADIAPHFSSAFAALPLAAWTYVAGPPPRIESSSIPSWTNNSGGEIGPFAGLAVYGTIGILNELMWVTPITPTVIVPAGDVLRVPDKVRFQVDPV